MTKLLVIVLKDASPCDKTGSVLKNGCRADAGPGIVQLMGKLMKDDIVTVVNVRCSLFDILPGQDNGSAAPGFSRVNAKPFRHDSVRQIVGNGSDIRLWVNKNGRQPRIIIRIAMQE